MRRLGIVLVGLLMLALGAPVDAGGNFPLNLTVNGQPGTEYSVTGSGGVDCGSTGHSTCDVQFQDGQGIALTANSIADSYFLGWTGACAGSGTNPTCPLTMNGPQAVTATFGKAQVSLAFSGSSDSVRIKKKRTARFPFTISNLGSAADQVTFRLGTGCTSSTRFDVRLFDDGLDVTTAALAGLTSNMTAAQSYSLFDLRITPKKHRVRTTCRVLLESANGPNASSDDFLDFSVQAKKKRRR